MSYTDLQIAHVCHEANRVLQLIQGDPAPSGPWEQAEHWQVDASLDTVRAIRGGATVEELHADWSAKKRADGWVFGVVKDAVAKTHPCLVPFAELGEGQRDKDHVFAAIVHALT